MQLALEDTAPERKTSEEERFEDDYYAYFEQPENSKRYKPTAYFLDEAFEQRPFSLLDVGCGNAALIKYLPERCDYWGVDHSKLAIDGCLKRYPNKNFICQDLSQVLSELVAEKKKFDAIVLSGILFHAADKETLEQKDDRELVTFCLNQILSPDGYLAIIIPFAYGKHPAHSLFTRAEWLQNTAENLLETTKAKIVYGNLSLLIGLEEKVRQQKSIPDWFVSDDTADYPNRFAGTYMAAWTFIATPNG